MPAYCWLLLLNSCFSLLLLEAVICCSQYCMPLFYSAWSGLSGSWCFLLRERKHFCIRSRCPSSAISHPFYHCDGNWVLKNCSSGSWPENKSTLVGEETYIQSLCGWREEREWLGWERMVFKSASQRRAKVRKRFSSSAHSVTNENLRLATQTLQLWVFPPAKWNMRAMWSLKPFSALTVWLRDKIGAGKR